MKFILLIITFAQCLSLFQSQGDFKLSLDERLKGITEEQYNETSDSRKACSTEYKDKFPKKLLEIDKYCCQAIYVNHCLEKKYGLSMETSLFLKPITDARCYSHLQNPMEKCNVDTREFGYKITKYSECHIMSNVYLGFMFKENEFETGMDIDFDLFKSPNETDKSGVRPDIPNFCCFKQAICSCYDSSSNCKEIDRSLLKDNLAISDYCDCTKIVLADDTDCTNYTHCPSSRDIIEYRDDEYFGYFLVVSFIFNLVCYCTLISG